MLDAYTLLFPGIPGGPELIVILLIAILLFGANKIPELARSSGQAIGEFQKGRQQVEEELKDMQDGDEEGETDTVESAPEETAGTAAETEPETEAETESQLGDSDDATETTKE